MPEKQPTLEDLAKLEADSLKKREQARKDYMEGQTKLSAEVPERFFVLAKQIREGVRRFNGAAPIQRPVQYTESPAVTTRDSNLNGDFSLEVKRNPNQVVVSLRSMGGSKAESFIIEAYGSVGVAPMVDRFRLRVDGIWKESGVLWRMACDKKALDITVDELGERIVMVIVTGQITRLWNVAPWVGDRLQK
ncbi:MAG: hypothetical protein EXR72_15120 [Myxococcales bacterium]|nr:hypothetical protein [Myxococcales bacterium]